MKKVMILFAALALTACGASNNSAKTGAEVETTTTTETVVEGTEEVQADTTKCEGCTGDCATCPNADGGACNCKTEEEAK